MRFTAFFVAMAACLVALIGLRAQPVDGAPPKASVTVAKCLTGPAAADRNAVFAGSMRRVKGSQRMWMRFTLQERVGRGEYEPKRAEGLGVWRKSRKRVGGFVHRQRVLGLDRATAYRVRVQYRWFDADRAVLRRTTKHSALCRQPGPRANLTVGRVTGKRLARGSRYVVRVHNAGRAAAPATTVRLTIDGGPVATARVPALGAGTTKRVSVEAPSCRTGLVAQVDPEGSVRESREGDNTRSQGCPLP